MKKTIKSSLISCLFVTLVVFSAFFVGCGSLTDFLDNLKSGYSVYFVDSTITLEKGEQRTFSYKDLKFADLSESVDPSTINFSLASSNSIAVGAAGKTITARSAGTARVTLTTEQGYKAYLDVKVAESAFDAKIVFPLGRVLPVDGEYSVDAYLVLNDGERSASDYKIAWSVNGKAVSFTGNPLTLYKQSAGVYEIKAAVTSNGKTLSATATAVYTKGEIISPEIVADTLPVSVGEKKTLTLKEKFDYAEWYVSGKLACEGSSFDFSAEKPGKYEIYAVCGDKVSKSVTVAVKGNVEIEELKANYDEAYPDLSVSWKGAEGATYRVTALSGNEIVKTLITAENQAVLQIGCDKPYEITVEAVSDGVLAPSEQKATLTVDAVDSIEKYYLQKKYCYGNYYISDEDEFFEFFDYMMYFRKQPIGVNSTRSSEKVYMAFDYGDYDDLLGRAFEFSGITGSYSIGGETDGRTATVTIDFYTVDTPSVASSYDQKYHCDNLGALPVNYASGEKIDYFSAATKGKISVTTTDQAYRVAEKGYVPQPVVGSSAERVYAYAENVLDSIVCKQMTDEQIARAVYEYIMNKNTYDGSVVNLDIEQSVKSASFYMESVLIESNEKGGKTYGVCDAMSKTFAFLCNMANVKAVRVTGYAGSGDSKGGHAWNKVLLDGQWYVVDCTWGDAGIKISKKSGFSSTSVRMESASHSYFLLTDEQVSKTHVEDNLKYPDSSAVPYDYYAREKAVTSQQSVPLYLQSTGTKLNSDLKAIAAYLVKTVGSQNKNEAYGVTVNDAYDGIEFAVCARSLEEAKQMLADKTSLSSFYRTLTSAGLSYNSVLDGNVVYLIVAEDGVLNNKVPASGDDPIHRFWWWL